MKKLLAAFALALFLGPLRPAFAGEPVFPINFADSSYDIEHSTISISSTSVTTINAYEGFREVYVGDPATTVNIFYRLDGVATNVATVGWWIPSAQGQKIETNGVISLQLGAGSASVVVRKIEIRKRP